MTEKFTIRDILVYTLLGLCVIFFSYLHFPCKITLILEEFKDYSDLSVLLIIPLSYLLGHILMSVDDLVFNGILKRMFPKTNPLKNWFLKKYNFIFFGYRNIGVRNVNNISDDEFLKTCDKLIQENKYEKAEYYQVMSDLFKGIFLIILISIIIDATNCIFELWKLILLFLIWYRAKMFSSYYVRMIIRNK